MIGIIITGHGNFATGMEANAKLLAGNSIQLTAIDFTDTSTPDELEQKLAAAARSQSFLRTSWAEPRI